MINGRVGSEYVIFTVALMLGHKCLYNHVWYVEAANLL